MRKKRQCRDQTLTQMAVARRKTVVIRAFLPFYSLFSFLSSLLFSYSFFLGLPQRFILKNEPSGATTTTTTV